MDLNKAPTKTIATLVFRGNKQLGEIPTGRRSVVEREVEEMRVAAAEKAEAEAKAKKKKGKK